jgi:hypothetical protein
MKSFGQTMSGFQVRYLEPEYASELAKFDNRAWLLARLRGMSSIDNSNDKASGADARDAANPAAELFRAGYLALAEG